MEVPGVRSRSQRGWTETNHTHVATLSSQVAFHSICLSSFSDSGSSLHCITSLSSYEWISDDSLDRKGTSWYIRKYTGIVIVN